MASWTTARFLVISTGLIGSLLAAGLAPATDIADAPRATKGAHDTLASSVDARYTDGYVEIDDIKMHYVSGGEGPPVLLLPGWLQTWYAWRGVMPALADAGFHVIVVDFRGMGHSSRPMSGYDTGQIAQDLSALMQRLGHQRYAVVGHDIGMWVGYALAADHPKAVERVALVEGGIPGLLNPPPEVMMPQAQSAFFWQFMFNQQPDLPEMLIQGHERAFMSYLFGKWAYRPERIALDEYADIYSMPGGLRAQMAYYRAFPETLAQNTRRARHKLVMPVLALGGDHGVRDLPQTMLRPVATHVRGGVLQACGHFAPEECPEALLAELLPFLNESRP
jgi:pimeloyl-ACP methyl ester carboxylesterase